MKLLDAGCGRGVFVFELARRGEAHGIDFNDKFIKEARQHAIEKSLNCNFKKGQLEEMPYEKSFFDEVHCHHTLEHVKNFEKSVRELARVMKEGGSVCITVPHWTMERTIKKMDYPKYFSEHLHLRIVDDQMLKKALSKLGIKPVKERSRGFLRAAGKLLEAKLKLPFENHSGLAEEQNIIISTVSYLDFIANESIAKITADVSRRKMHITLPLLLAAKPFLYAADRVLSNLLAYEYNIIGVKA